MTLLDELRSHLVAHGTAPGLGAPDSEIAAFEARHGVRLPPDVRAYFAAVDGMLQGRDDMDDDMVSLYRLREVESLGDPEPDGGRYFAFGDWSIGIHAFAVRLSPDPAAPADVRIDWGGRIPPQRAAASFTEFLRGYLRNDPSVLYGVDPANETSTSRPVT